jgi:hypothetical protein
MKNEPRRALPADVLRELRYEIARAELEYDDNYRAYRARDNHMREDFTKIRRDGCCGSFETSIVDDAGDKWIVGCNYGH